MQDTILMHPKDTIETHFRLLEPQKKALKRLRLVTIHDLLYHFPTRYIGSAEGKAIKDVKEGDTALLYGKLSKLKTSKAYRKKIPMAEGFLEDTSGKIKIVWFHQPYLAKMLPEGSFVKVEGKVAERNGILYLTNPEVERIGSGGVTAGESLFEGPDAPTLFPIYPESRGITSRWFYHALDKVFKAGILDTLEDPIPTNILKTYNLPSLSSALVWIHTPQKEIDSKAARKRFAFEEVFLIQLKKQQERFEYNASPSWEIEPTSKDLHTFIDRFPFTPTKAQDRAVQEILTDFKTPSAMSRLLEGDVGSGKTYVAATTAYATVTTSPKNTEGTKQTFGNLQVAYMAPTEILATQHFESFIEYFKDLPIQIGLITSSGCKKFPSKVNPNSWTEISRTQLLKWVKNAEIPILIGTHSLIQKTVEFKHLAYVIIDEQHRFGTNQRKALVRRQSQTERRPTQKSDSELLYEDLSFAVRGVLFAVRKKLGVGHKEVVYQKAITEELTKVNITFEREKQIDVEYEGKKIGVYQPDFIIDNKILLEIKALHFVGEKEKKQVWTYLKGSTYKLALLANFGPKGVDIERLVYDSARNLLRQSASSLRESAEMLPHLLSMTATPIPRTLALTIYGDLDLTLLDELPPGRKEIITEVVAPAQQKPVYEKIRQEIKNGRQTYVICPRIDEPDETKANALQLKSVKAEAERLKQEVFTEYSVGILHGKMRPKEKEDVMQEFANGSIDILVATSVVEVGVNVPNATNIIIEGAERFGLAQLHQLRGRVFRSSHQAYCYLFTESKSKHSLERLKALATAKNGFELAEYDLQFRGAGELYGKKQWGITDVGMEALKNIKMVEAARNEAHTLIKKDPKLKVYPLLQEASNTRGDIHFE